MTTRRKNLLSSVENFLLAPATAHPIAALRIGVALVLLAQAYLLRGEVWEMFSTHGIVQGELANYMSVAHAPRVSWLNPLFASTGIGERGGLYLVCWLYVLSLVSLAIGWKTKAASIASWFLHWTLINTSFTTNYGADMFAHIFLFYMMWMPVGAAYSVDRLLGNTSGEPTPAARLSLRVLQIQLCIVYLASGIEKSAGIQWWNGEVLWRAFSLPVYHQYDMAWLCNYPWLSKIGGWGTLLVELGYAFFIWPKATRKLWIAATVSLHVGIAVFLGLDIFGAIMSVFTPAIFGFSPEPGPSFSSNKEPVSASGVGAPAVPLPV